jgi:hypothetical protein
MKDLPDKLERLCMGQNSAKSSHSRLIAMNGLFRYLAALLPIVLTLGGWQLSVFLFEHLGCQGDIKHMKPCFAGGIDLLPVLGVGQFWLPLASLVTGPISFALVVKVIVHNAATRRSR